MRPALLCLLLSVPACTAEDPLPLADGGGSGDAAQGLGRWAPMAEVGGGPIQEIAVAALGDKLYLLGGFDDTLQIGNRLQVYDPIEDSWSLGAPLPEPMHHANMASALGKLYVLGGMNLEGFGFRAIGTSYVYDPLSNAWQSLSPMPAGSERGACAMGVIDDVIYLAGGLRETAVAELSSYDPSEDRWDQSLPALPAPIDHLMGAAVGGSLFAIGGRGGEIESIRNTTYAFTPGGAWQERAPMPTARGGGAAGVVAGKIIVVGGEGNSAAASGVFSQTESYDPLLDTWTPLLDMPLPRHGMGAAGIGPSLYVPGGATIQAFGAVSAGESFTP